MTTTTPIAMGIKIVNNKKTHFRFLFEILLNRLDGNIIFLMISIWALDEDIYTSLSF